MTKKAMRVAICMFLCVIFLVGIIGCGTSQDDKSSTDTASYSQSVQNEQSSTAATSQSIDADQTVTLMEWGSAADDPDFKNLSEQLTKDSGVKVNVIKAPNTFDQYQSKAATIFSSGDSSIDIFCVDEYIFWGNVKGNFFVPLDDVYSEADKAQFPAAYLKNMCTYNGKLYSVPLENSWYPFHVNKKLLDEAGLKVPTTKDEFINAAKVLTKNGTYGYGAEWGKSYMCDNMQYFCIAFGGNYLDWTNKGTQDAIKFMYDLINTYKCTPSAVLGDDHDVVKQKVLDGKYAMCITWDFIAPAAVSAGKYGSEVIIAPNPRFSNTPTGDSCLMGAWMYVLNKASIKVDAAKKVMAALAAKDANLFINKQWNTVPIRLDNMADPAFSDPKTFPAADIMNSLAKANKMYPRSMTGKMSDIIESTETIMSMYLTNDISFEECIKRGQAELDRLMGK